MSPRSQGKVKWDEADQKRALDSGFDMHLTKPLDFERLKAINLGF